MLYHALLHGRPARVGLSLVGATLLLFPQHVLTQDQPPATTILDAWQRAAMYRYQHGQQQAVSTRSGEWDVRLDGPTQCSLNCHYRFSAHNLLTEAKSSFSFANGTAQVNALTLLTGDRLAVIGITPELTIISILKLPSGAAIDKIICGNISLSPDHRYFVFIKFTPTHPGYGWSPSTEYLAYDLTQPPGYNRTPPNRNGSLEPYDAGWPLYPLGATNKPGDNIFEGQDLPVHLAMSKFFWLGRPDSVAFVDRYKGDAALVIADLSLGIQHPLVEVYPLNVRSLVSLDKCKQAHLVSTSALDAWAHHPAQFMTVDDIRLCTQSSRVAQISFAPSACLQSNVLNVDIGPSMHH